MVVACIAALAVASVVIVVLQPASSSLTVTNEGRPAQFDSKATNVAYWVPLSAPLEELDATGSDATNCGEELSVWLTEYGTLLPSPQALLLRSKSTEPLPVSFSADGAFSEPRDGLLVQCGAPQLQTGEAEPGELDWTPLLLRLEEDAEGALRALTPTADGPEAADITANAASPVGLIGLIQGDLAFEGTIRAHADGAPVPVPFEGARSDDMTISWPGMPSRGTLRVAVGLTNSGKAAFFCQVASSTSRGGECLAQEDDETRTIRGQAENLRADYLTVRDSVAEAFRQPRPTPDTGSRTEFVRVDPWNDAALEARGVEEQFVGWCNQSAFRADRVTCETGADCFLNHDASKAACGDPATDTWTIYGFTAPVQPAFDDGTEPTVYPVALRLVSGAWCTFSSSGPEVEVVGWGGSAGSCVEDDGTAYAFWSTYPSGPLGQPYLFKPGMNDYLRIAARDGTPENPDYEDVAEIYY
ncbi:hypothetical protein SAMN05216554_3219 [Herbiconiux ginsengi]|uniref:Uncharacterized protein n=2 Tax=Herbiconiux ginsengi TaxID=381665 RepID=A0A1H3S0W4_9MICO|nr:hypothetical protein SAMN05216554_3219 [Herbiconiux ginsengi]